MAGAVASLTLSGCAPVRDGLVGITVDAGGQLLGTVRPCRHPLDGVILQPSNHAAGAYADDIAVGEWALEVDVSTTTVSWPIVGQAGSGVRVIGQVGALPDERLSMFGWTRNGSSMADYVYFGAADLARLEPGLILVGEGQTITADQFDRTACEAAR